MKYDFDWIIDRKNTNCVKWDGLKELFGQEDLLPLWVADMDFAAPPQVIRAIKKRAEHGIFGYSFEPEEYYLAFIDWQKKRFGWQIKRDWIVNSPGIVPAINFAIQCYTNPGDKIIVQTPVYFPFFQGVRLNDRIVSNSPLILVDDHYEMDFADLEQKMKAAEMMLLCSPHNPVGRVWTAAELTRLVSLCQKYGVLLISDEIHADLILKSHHHIPTALFSEQVISLYAPSKTFNIAGLTVSSVVIPDSAKREKFQNHLLKLGIHLQNIFGIEAFLAAYKYGEDWLKALMEYIEANYDFATDFLKRNIPLLRAIKMEGTYLMWLDCRKLGLDQKELVELFVRAGVALNDGSLFGHGGEGFLRMNIGCPRLLLQKALLKMQKAVDALTSSTAAK